MQLHCSSCVLLREMTDKFYKERSVLELQYIILNYRIILNYYSDNVEAAGVF